MDLFDHVFTLFMILFPALFTLFIRRRDADTEMQARNRRLTGILWLATAATVLLYLLLARWYPAVSFFMWMAFFPLWFLLAMPMIQTRDPGWRPLQRDNQRSASLVRRDVLPIPLRIGWIMITVLWSLLLCVAILGLVLEVSRPVMWWLLVFNLAAGFELWILHWGMHRSLIEPEAASPGESASLRDEREAFHRFKLYGWFWLATLAMLIFSLPPLLLIWYGNQALTGAIAIGAGGGMLAGIGGGVFGTIASIRRARINRLSLETSSPE